MTGGPDIVIWPGDLVPDTTARPSPEKNRDSGTGPVSGELRNASSGGAATVPPGISASILAARHLCRKKEPVLGLIGAGPCAGIQLEALSREFSLAGVKVWDEVESRAESFSRNYSGFGIAVANPKTTTDCDLLVTTIPSRKPVVRALWVHEGTHISALGSREPGMQALEPTLIALGKVFVYDRQQAARAGEINVPLARGFFRPDMIAGTLEDIVLGKKGRMSEQEITIFDAAGSLSCAGPSAFRHQPLPYGKPYGNDGV